MLLVRAGTSEHSADGPPTPHHSLGRQSVYTFALLKLRRVRNENDRWKLLRIQRVRRSSLVGHQYYMEVVSVAQLHVLIQ